ncbi:UNVERIFIED_CONTAM: hypothetical protein BEN50_15920 [Euhalothece sp. KZN 001]
MSHNSDDHLVNFIRQYNSSPPPPKVDLEAEIMAHVEIEPQREKVVAFPQIAFGGVIAASVLLLFTSVRLLQPTFYSPQPSAELEHFLTENWEAVTTPPPSDTSWQTLTTEKTKSSN